MNNEYCKLKFDKHGNPNIIASLYPSIICEIDKDCIVNEYQTKQGKYIVEVDTLKIKNFKRK